jgi:hypothetical protein
MSYLHECIKILCFELGKSVVNEPKKFRIQRMFQYENRSSTYWGGYREGTGSQDGGGSSSTRTGAETAK